MRPFPQTTSTPENGESLGVDVGGTTIKGVLLSSANEVLREERVTTPRNDTTGEKVADAVTGLVSKFRLSRGVPVGVVVPGIVDEARGIAVHSSNVGFRNAPVAAHLAERLGENVAFGHDVRAGALAEHLSGAGQRESGISIFLPIGTGIAAAVLIDGEPVVSDGWSGEIGQVILDRGPFSGQRMELAASASAIARQAGTEDAKEVAERIIRGDALCQRIWSDAVNVIAEALALMIATLGPRTVILGGGLARSGSMLLEPLETGLRGRLSGMRMPELRIAEHGDRAAAYGAVYLARAKSSSPSGGDGYE